MGEMENQGHSGDSSWVTTFVFIAGFLLGSGLALLMAPEAGSAVRGRLAKGVKAAQDEFAEMAADSKDAFNSWSKDAQEAIKQATSRVTSAVDATKQAVKDAPTEGATD